EQALVLRPRSTVAHDLVARIQLLRDPDKAKPEIEAVQRAIPSSAEAFDLAGVSELAHARPEAARDAYERALQLDPQDLQALAGLAQIDLAAGRGSDALARFDANIARPTPSADLLFLAA